MNKELVKNLKSDFPAGLVVFLVALPLCMGIALASGAPLFSGIIAGIVGGTVVGILSGSSVSVSGPAAGLTVIVLAAIEQLEVFEVFLLAVFISGILQLLLGVFKAGFISHYVPSSVIKGMLAAIGLILILKQIPHALGYDQDYIGNINFLQHGGGNTFSEIANALNYISPGTVIICFISLMILGIWDRPALKNKTFFKLVPGALIAVLTGIFLNLIYQNFFPGFSLSGDHLVQLPVAESAAGFLDQISMPDWKAISNPEIYVIAITITIVSSLETLLNIEATDKIDPFKRITSTDRELKAQGIGNMVSGLIGGLPVTSVIVRSSTNIAAGSKSKMSAIIHGFLLILTVAFIPGLLNMIPLACLAAVLFMVGYKLAKVSLFRQMYQRGWNQFLPFVVTVLAILFTDLLQGVAIGMVVAIFFILRNNYKSPYTFHDEPHEKDHKYVIKLSEEVSFLNKGSVQLTLRNIPEDSHVTIDGTKSIYIDHDVMEIINNFKETARLKNIELNLISLNGNGFPQINKGGQVKRNRGISVEEEGKNK